MDNIFGQQNFRNEIVWQRITGAGKTTQHEQYLMGDQLTIYFSTHIQTVNLIFIQI